MWLPLILLYVVFGAAGYLLRRKLAQRFGEHIPLMNAVFFICFLLPVGAIFALFLPHNLHVGWVNLVLLLGGSLVWPVMNLVAFYANKYIDASIFVIINNVSPLFTLAIALSLLNESVSALQYVGIGLLIFSGIVAAFARTKGNEQVNLRGILLCFLSAALLGTAVAYERFMLERVDFGAYIVYGWGAQIFWAAVLAGRELHRLPSLFAKESGMRYTLTAWGVTSVLKSTAFISALKLGTASLVSAASNFLSIVVVIAAYIFLKERSHMMYKVIATIVGIVGLFLIAG